MFNLFIEKNKKNLILDNRSTFVEGRCYNIEILKEWGIIDKKVE
jgi:hypothetical protein